MAPSVHKSGEVAGNYGGQEKRVCVENPKTSFVSTSGEREICLLVPNVVPVAPASQVLRGGMMIRLFILPSSPETAHF